MIYGSAHTADSGGTVRFRVNVPNRVPNEEELFSKIVVKTLAHSRRHRIGSSSTNPWEGEDEDGGEEWQERQTSESICHSRLRMCRAFNITLPTVVIPRDDGWWFPVQQRARRKLNIDDGTASVAARIEDKRTHTNTHTYTQNTMPRLFMSS